MTIRIRNSCITVGLLIHLFAGLAQAEITPRSLEAGLFIGHYWFDASQYLKAGPVAGLRLGYAFTPHVTLEGSLADPLAQSSLNGNRAKTRLYRINGLYHLKPQSRFVPFVGGGIGSLSVEDSGRSPTVNVGAGVKYFLTQNIVLRGDLWNITASVNDYGRSRISNFEATFAVEYLWQKKEARSPLPTVPMSDLASKPVPKPAPKSAREGAKGTPSDSTRAGKAGVDNAANANAKSYAKKTTGAKAKDEDATSTNAKTNAAETTTGTAANDQEESNANAKTYAKTTTGATAKGQEETNVNAKADAAGTRTGSRAKDQEEAGANAKADASTTTGAKAKDQEENNANARAGTSTGDKTRPRAAANTTNRANIITYEFEFEFAFNVATLKRESYENIQGLAKLMKQYSTAPVKIEGHTDNIGDPAYNLLLSQWRADSVRKALIGLGVAEERFSVNGFGEEEPVDDNATPKGRQVNRRVIARLTVRVR